MTFLWWGNGERKESSTNIKPLVQMIENLKNEATTTTTIKKLLKKVNLLPFKRYRVYLDQFKLGDFSWSCILRVGSKRERGKFVVVCLRPP